MSEISLSGFHKWCEKKGYTYANMQHMKTVDKSELYRKYVEEMKGRK